MPTVIKGSGDSTFIDNIKLGDGDKIKLGDSDDLQIYHDGGHSYINDTGTGDLIIVASNNHHIKFANGHTAIHTVENAEVNLRYANVNKLATTSTGIDVTGTINDLSLISGGSNVALGDANTMISISTGTENTALGSLSMDRNNSGAGNVAVGRESLNRNTTGDNNVAIGKLAMYTNVTGSNNAAVGQQALRLNSSGVNNTAMGQYSLRNSTGNSNTALGREAGDNITTGDNNIAIGSGIDVNTGTTDNQLNIGNWIIGKDNGKIICFSKGSNSTTMREVVLSGNVNATDDTWMTVAYLNHTHTGIVKVVMYDSGDRGAVVGTLVTAYGANVKSTQAVVLNGLSNIDFRYNNSGYVLQVKMDTPDNVSREMFWSFTGMCASTPYLTS